MQTEILIKNSTLKVEAVHIKINGLTYLFTGKLGRKIVKLTTEHHPALNIFINQLIQRNMNWDFLKKHYPHSHIHLKELHKKTGESGSRLIRIFLELRGYQIGITFINQLKHFELTQALTLAARKHNNLKVEILVRELGKHLKLHPYTLPIKNKAPQR